MNLIDRFLGVIGQRKETAEEQRSRIHNEMHVENMRKITAGYTRTLDPGWSIWDLCQWRK